MCVECSASFTEPVRRGRIAKRCLPCRDARRIALRRREPSRNAKRWVEKPKPKTCVQCSASFVGLRDRNYCTLACQYRWKREHYTTKRCATAGCGALPITRKSTYCIACKDLQQARRALLRTLRAIAKASRLAEKACPHCGTTFRPRQGGMVFCSRQCGDAHHRHACKARRRARVAGGRVYRYEIIERDKGICQLCSEPVDFDVDPQHPLAPSMDHIVPLALGGVHHPDNVQLAHRHCNCLKSDGRGNIDRRVAA